jgi:hypothetical protein
MVVIAAKMVYPVAFSHVPVAGKHRQILYVVKVFPASSHIFSFQTFPKLAFQILRSFRVRARTQIHRQSLSYNVSPVRPFPIPKRRQVIVARNSLPDPEQILVIFLAVRYP